MLSHLSRMQLCDPMDCILPDSSVNGILQARILQWVAMPSSRESPWPSLVKITQSFSNAEIIFSHSSMNQNKYVLCVQNSPGRQQHLSDLVDVGRSRGAVFLLVSERKAKGSSAETLQPRGGHLLAGKHGPPKPGKDSQPCGISQQWSCSHPERRLPGGRRRRCRAPAAPALPHSRWSLIGVSRFSCRACLLPALCSLLSTLSRFLPQASGCQPHQLRAPQLLQRPAFPEAPVAGWQRADGDPSPGFQELISAAGHDLGPEQNTPHTRLCLWKPLQLGGSVSFIDFSPLTVSKFTKTL